MSRITESLHEEDEAFAPRDLSGLDAVCRRHLRVAAPAAGCREGLLVPWAILGDGSKVLVYLSLG